MKTIVLLIVGFCLLLFGAAGFGVTLGDLGRPSEQGPIFGFTMAACLIVIGALLFWAAKAKYRLSWSLVFGTLLAFFGLAMVGMTLDDIVCGKTEEAGVGFGVSSVFAICGILLIRAGHRHHKKKVEPDVCVRAADACMQPRCETVDKPTEDVTDRVPVASGFIERET
jgi:hypothetical protein